MSEPLRTGMRALRFSAVGQPLEVATMPVPEPSAGSCLVRVGAVGLCGSDAHILSGHTATGRQPITLGHELAGTVAEGHGDDTHAAGSRVFVNPIIGCGSCAACERRESNLCPRRAMLGIHLDGGLAQYVSVPRANLLSLPAGLDPLSAPLIESAGTAHHALRAGRVSTQDVVVVVGVGGLGMQVLRMAQARGAIVVAIDLDPVSRNRAVAAGAACALDPTTDDLSAALTDLGRPDGADVAVDCVGSTRTVLGAVEQLRHGGRCVLIGIGDQALALPPPGVFVRRSWSLSAVYAYSQADLLAVVDHVARGELDLRASVSRVVDLSGTEGALRDLQTRTASPLRVIVDPWFGTEYAWSADVH